MLVNLNFNQDLRSIITDIGNYIEACAQNQDFVTLNAEFSDENLYVIPVNLHLSIAIFTYEFKNILPDRTKYIQRVLLTCKNDSIKKELLKLI